MKSFAVVAGLLATLAATAPARNNERQFKATITFEGAAGASYELLVPTDGSEFYIYNTLSVSEISSLGGATCSFKGAQGSDVVIVGSGNAVVGPPQVQVSGSCLAF